MADSDFSDYVNSGLSVLWTTIKYLIIFIISVTLIFVIGVWIFLRWLFSESNFVPTMTSPTSKDYMRMTVRKLQHEIGVNIF